MTITHLQLHYGLPFDQYQRLHGVSFSNLKHGDRYIEPTPKMALGKAVDQYLTSPEHFKGDISIVKPIAQCIRYTIGDLWEHLQHQVGVTCRMEHEGLGFWYRGLPDSMIKGKLVIDYKVGENIRKSMFFMSYPEQINGYGTAINAPLRLLIAVNPKSRKPQAEVIRIEPSTSYWEQTVLLKGELIESITREQYNNIQL